MLPQLIELFKSTTKALEVLYLVEGIKPVVRFMVHDNELDKVKDFCDNNNLHYTYSNYKVAKLEQSRYSNKGVRLTLQSPMKGKLLFYISRDQAKVNQAKLLEENDDHVGFGQILGYPKCCCEFFNKFFPIESKKQNDFVSPAIQNSQGYSFSFYNNIFGRYFDITLLNHCPCSFHCEESIAIAKKNFDCLSKHSTELSAKFLSMLKSVALYTEYAGIFLLTGNYFVGDYLAFKEVHTNSKNRFYEDLTNIKKITIHARNHMSIEDRHIKNDISALLFN